MPKWERLELKKYFLTVWEKQMLYAENYLFVKNKAQWERNVKAKMVIKLKERGKWVVEAVDDIHSHRFASPSKVQNIRSHKNLASTSKKLIGELYFCGIGPSKITRVLNHNGGGIDKGEFTLNDCKIIYQRFERIVLVSIVWKY